MAGEHGYSAIVEVLLGVAPAAATTASLEGWLPLHSAAHGGYAAVTQLLLDAAPATAMAAAEEVAWLPLHLAARQGHAVAAQLLLTAAPEAAMVADDDDFLPLHLAARGGHASVAKVLLTAAPAAATVGTATGFNPLHMAIGGIHYMIGCSEVARCLLVGAPDAASLAILAAAGDPARHLFADCVSACIPLTKTEWALVPTPCYGLGRSLPSAFEHSADQAAHVVRRLPPADGQRLHTVGLCLVRMQRRTHVALPPDVTGKLILPF